MDSIIAGVGGAIFLLIGGMLHLLWNPKSLKEVTAWRQKLEEAMKSGTHAVVDEWESHGLEFPISPEGIEVELAGVRKQEDELQKARKLVIVLFLALGTLLIIVDLVWR